MKRIAFMIIAFICAMQVIYAQDSLSIKMNQIDIFRENILKQKDNLLCVKFPLNLHPVDENSCYIDYEKPDTIYYYFKDSNLVFVEHRMDRMIGDCDTDYKRVLEYERTFFMKGRLCLEEYYDNAFSEGWDRSDKGKEIITTFCYVEESRTYWDVAIDKKLVNKNRGTMPNSPILESKVDSVMNATEWEYYYVDKTSFDYKYDSGEDEARVKCFSKIKKNGFVFPDSVKMPYSE